MSDTTNEGETQARSLQCDVCGLKFRNAPAAQLHAEKTEHQAFSESVEEIKPLTEEEKKAKLQDLRDKLAVKRKLEAEKELENTKKNAVIERKKTQESADVIEQLKRKEELKQIANRKKEKEEEAKAKLRVRAQLEQDKKDRAEKVSREKALREGQNVPTNTPAISTAPKKIVDHASARLQIRFGTDKPIIRSWSKSTTMLQVAIDIEPETGCEPDKAIFKMFGQTIRGDDLQRTLEDLKLTPSASLQLS